MARDKLRRNASIGAYRARLKKFAFDILGDRCAKCGFADERALQIDHIDGGGGQERFSLGGTRGIYKRVVDVDGEGYQILCANCNWIKRHENNESGLTRHSSPGSTRRGIAAAGRGR